MNLEERVFGWLSITLCLIGFAFQSYRLFIQKSARAISTQTFLITSFGSMFWSLHGVVAHAFHGGFENSIITFFSGIILYYALRAKHGIMFARCVAISICLIACCFASILLVDYIKPELLYFQSPKMAKFATGIVAGLLMSSSFVPQVIKAVKTKYVHEISLFMTTFYGLAQIVLVVYWSSRSSHIVSEWLPGVIFCSCVLFFQGALFSLKIVYSKQASKKLA